MWRELGRGEKGIGGRGEEAALERYDWEEEGRRRETRRGGGEKIQCGKKVGGAEE